MRHNVDKLPHSGSHNAFIVGAGRSGTTLLYKLLCLHPGVGFISNYDNRLSGLAPALMQRVFRHAYRAKLAAWFGRSGAAYMVRRRALMKLVPSPVEGEQLFRACGISGAAGADGAIAPAALAELRRRLERIGAGAGTPVTLCKRTAINRFIGSLDAAMPGSRYIHLIRDGRDVANSLSRVDWWNRHVVWWDGRTAGEMEKAGEPRLAVCARNWVAEVEAIQRGLAGVDRTRVLEIHYEDLLERPIPVLGNVLGFLGLELGHAMSAAVTALALRRRSPGGPSGWSERDRSLVNSEAAPLLAQFGYLETGEVESS